jgi:hypothetical protein
MNTDTVSTSTTDVVETETNCTTGNVTDTTTQTVNNECEDKCDCEEECTVECECNDDCECDCEEEEEEEEEEEIDDSVYVLYLDDTIRGYVKTLEEAKNTLIVLSQVFSGGILSRYITRSEANENTGTIYIYGRYRFMSIISYSAIIATLRYQKVSRLSSLS